NPDNPMGGYWEAAAIEAMIVRLPAGALLCLDEAYIETAPEDAEPPLNPEQPNVLRFRTFSKAMGLAGLRVGYAIGPARLIAAYDRVRNHFGVGRVAQAGALAALGDERHLLNVVAQVAEGRAHIANIARAQGLKPLPSATNFVAIDCGQDGGFAQRILEALAARGVFVRMPGVSPLNRCIRVSCGREQDLAAFEQALPEALAEAQG
nr:aminotransferase class I/II-fold pyridoxal phosphate-dependent enzyme [Paracoccaceae bacterium]